MSGLAILLVLAACLWLKAVPPFRYDTPSERLLQATSPHGAPISETDPEKSAQEHLELPTRASGTINEEERCCAPDGDLKARQLLPEPVYEEQVMVPTPPPRLKLAPLDLCDSVGEIPRAECEALVTLYHSADGPHWLRSDGWLSTTTPCSWHGVACKDGHVVYLGLFSNALKGSIPSELGNLTELEMLILYDNYLSGPLPTELGNLASLTHLRLYNNQLSGTIPDLSNLVSLTDLVLKSNRFSGPFPDLGGLSNLRILYLSCNLLSGEVPYAVTELGNLRPYSTDLGYNMLTASSPRVVAFLNAKDPDWVQTQTVPPTDVRVVDMSDNSVALGWIPIAYTGDGGYYEVSYSMAPGVSHTDTISKTQNGYLVADVAPCASDSFTMAVRTYTPAHGTRGLVVYQQNELWSEREEISIVPLPSPSLSSPSDGGSAFSVATLTWDRVGGATSYRVQVATDPGFSSTPTNYTSSISYTTGALSEDVTYYWRVGASNLCGEGPWSEIREFTVRASWLFLPLVNGN